MKNWIYAAALGLGMAITGPALAATITFGNTNPVLGNAYPFTHTTYVSEYQQVYDGSFFSGPSLINQITFFAGPGVMPGITGNFTLNFSTTSKSPATLGTVYANNLGLDNTLFFSGAVSNTLTFTGSPFLFDPSKGNLLLDVLVNTPASANSSLIGSCGSDTNRAFSFSGTGPAVGTGTNPGLCSPNSFGLKTQFTFTAVSVPEPTPLAMFGAGLLGLLGLAAVRGRKQA